MSVQAQLLFTWTIPHLDCEGRMRSNPVIIKGTVVPFVKEFTVEIIADCLRQMAACGLIKIFGDKQQYMWFPGFPKHQKIRKDFEAPSDIPDPESFNVAAGTQEQASYATREHTTHTTAETTQHAAREQIDNADTTAQNQSHSQSQGQVQTQSQAHIYSEAAPGGAIYRVAGESAVSPGIGVSIPAKSAKQPLPVITDLIAYFQAGYRNLKGEPYVPKKPKDDCRRLEELIAVGFTPEDIKERIDRFFAADAEHIKTSDHSMRYFAAVFNRLSKRQKSNESPLVESTRIRAERKRAREAAKLEGGKP